MKKFLARLTYSMSTVSHITTKLNHPCNAFLMGSDEVEA